MSTASDGDIDIEIDPQEAVAAAEPKDEDKPVTGTDADRPMGGTGGEDAGGAG